jgi:hypothetical protein
MKLELKHLTPYLPHKLRVIHDGKNKMLNVGRGSSNNWIGLSALLRWQEREHLSAFPILRPLSDLKKEITVGNSTFIPIDVIRSKPDFETALWGVSVMTGDLFQNRNIEYSLAQKLFKWHFDVFGLIGKNLAIDINSIN